MYGTLKGFAKFLFDSPTKENSRLSDQIKYKIDMNDEIISQISLTEKAFAVYCEQTHSLYLVNENFEKECILIKELKSFQFLNGTKFIIA